MKRFLKKSGAVVLSLCIVLSMILTEPILSLASTKKGEDITIFFTHDMHSHLEKFPKLKTVVDEIRAEKDNVYLFDAGDFAMGTPYQTVFKEEASELYMMGFAGYDVTTLGNHEFDLRSKGLAAMINRAASYEEKLPQMVNSNIDCDKTLGEEALREDGENLKAALERYGSKEYTVIEKEDTSIAVFGIFGKNSASYAPESGTYFKDPVESAKEVVKKIRDNEDVDMIVCVSHSGTNANPEKSEDEILAKEVDGIDMIVSGHSHTELPEPIIHNDTIVASQGQYNKNIGKITFSKKGDKYEMSDYELIPLNDSIEDNEEALLLLQRFKDSADEKYFSKFDLTWDEALCENDIEFTDIDDFAHDHGDDKLGSIMADALRYGVMDAEGNDYEEVSVTVAPAGCIRGGIPTGEVTTEDAFNALSIGTGRDNTAGYPLVSVYLTGSEIKLCAEIDASISDLMGPARLYFSGLNYNYSSNRLFLNRAYDIMHVKYDEDYNIISTEEFEDDRLYRCVADLYSAQMLGTVEGLSKGLLSLTPKDKDGNPVEDYEEQIIYDKDGNELKEWYALAAYMQKFKKDGVPEIYSSDNGDNIRKYIIDEDGLWIFFKKPNKFMKMAIGIVVALILLIALVVVLIVKRRKKKRNKNRYNGENR